MKSLGCCPFPGTPRCAQGSSGVPWPLTWTEAEEGDGIALAAPSCPSRSPEVWGLSPALSHLPGKCSNLQ